MPNAVNIHKYHRALGLIRYSFRHGLPRMLSHGLWKTFQKYARARMETHFNVALSYRRPSGSPKKFDLVSKTEDIVGDAKCLTLVAGERLPPAKFMEIAGYVWLLESMSVALPPHARERVFVALGRISILLEKRRLESTQHS